MRRRARARRALGSGGLALTLLAGMLSWSAATPAPAAADFQENRCTNWAGLAAYFYAAEPSGAHNDTAHSRDHTALVPTGTAPDFLDLQVPSLGVLGNDGQVTENGRLISNVEALLYEGPAHAKSFTLFQDGGYSYVPRDGYTGGDSFRYVWARDGYCSNIATVTIPATASPRLRDDTYTAVAGKTLEVGVVCGSIDRCGVLANDIVASGRVNRLFIPEDQWDDYGPFTFADPWLTWPVTMRTDHGSVTMRASGAFTYTPDAGFEGQDSFFYTSDGATDPWGAHSPRGSRLAAKVTFDVAVPDTSIVAVADGPLEATEDTPLVITPATLLVNDHRGAVVATQSFDADWPSTLCAEGTMPCFRGTIDSGRTAHGSLTTTWDGFDPFPDDLVNLPTSLQNITYTPDPGFHGTDSFTYIAADSAGEFAAGTHFSFPAEVVIEVEPVPDGITAQDDAAATLEETPLTIDALANDVDEDGDIDPASLDHDPCDTERCDRRHGTWTDNGDGTLRYTPRAEFSGQAVFPYVVRDADGNIDFAAITVTVTADDAVDDDYATDEDTPLIVGAAVGVLDNDDAPSTGPFAASLGDGPDHGDVDLESDGAFTYTPDADFNGTDSFTYAASGDTATVTIETRAVDDAPYLRLNSACDPATLPEGGICFDLYNAGDFDRRHTDEAGNTVILRGHLIDGELDGGSLTVDWGDGEQTSLDWPCVPLAEDCPFEQARTHTVDCLLFPGVCAAPAAWFDLSHRYLDDPAGDAPTFAIDVTVSDVNGADRDADVTARVANLDPTLTIAPDCPAGGCIGASDLTVNEGETAVLRGRITDPGRDHGTITVDWGDGTTPSEIELGCGTGEVCAAGPIVAERLCIGTQAAACGYWQATHVYGPPSVSAAAVETPAQYTIDVTADDDDGGQDTGQATATVSALPPGILPSAAITTPGDGATYLLDEAVLADYSCDDDVSVISCIGTVPDGSPVDTSTVGRHTFTVDATDDESLTRRAVADYRVVYDFAWVRPATPRQRAYAGLPIAVRFSLAGDQGLDVLSSVRWRPVSCTTGRPTGPASAAATTDLVFRARTGVYELAVQTERAWTGCRRLFLRLDDRTQPSVVVVLRALAVPRP